MAGKSRATRATRIRLSAVSSGHVQFTDAVIEHGRIRGRQVELPFIDLRQVSQQFRRGGAIPSGERGQTGEQCTIAEMRERVATHGTSIRGGGTRGRRSMRLYHEDFGAPHSLARRANRGDTHFFVNRIRCRACSHEKHVHATRCARDNARATAAGDRRVNGMFCKRRRRARRRRRSHAHRVPAGGTSYERSFRAQR